MPEDHLGSVKALLIKHEERYRISAQRWKWGYRVLLIASAVLSTSAALIGQIGFFMFDRADVAAILAGLATVITTIIAALDFDINWRVNRRSRHDICGISLEAEKSTADPDRLLFELQQVIKRRSDDLNRQD